MIYGDNGLGITTDSKEFIEYCIKKGDLKPEEMKHIMLSRNIKYGIHNVIIFMNNGDEFRISGFNWGYGGEGPHGLLWLLEKLGTITEVEKDRHMHIIASLNMDMDYLIIKGSGKIELTEWGYQALEDLGLNVSRN